MNILQTIMKKFFNKLKISNFILALGFLFAIVSFFLPKTGSLVLLDEATNILALCFFYTYLLLLIFKAKRLVETTGITSIKEKVQLLVPTIIIVIVTVFVIFATVILSMNIVLDVINGTQTITLSNAIVTHYNAGNGFVSNHYYLMGKDENDKNHRVEISSNDYYSYDKSKRTVTLEYYPNISRVVKFWYWYRKR